MHIADVTEPEAPAAARDVHVAPLVTAEGRWVPSNLGYQMGSRASSKRLWSGCVIAFALVRGARLRDPEAESQLAKQLLYSGIVKALGFT